MDLASERSATQKLENGRMMMERQAKENKAKITELESQMKTRSKAMISSLETKIASLEEQVEVETKFVFCDYSSCDNLHDNLSNNIHENLSMTIPWTISLKIPMITYITLT